MSHPLPRRPASLALALGLSACSLVAVAATPTAASAARFGQPVVISGNDEVASSQIAIAPNGRTAVLYLRTVPKGSGERYEFRAAFGPSPDRLGAPQTVKAGWRTAAYYGGVPQLLARPDGGFVACFPDATRRKKRVNGCSVASPTGTFGKLHAVPDGRVSAVVRPDSSAVLLIENARYTSKGKFISRSDAIATMSPLGEIGPARPFTRGATEDAGVSGVPIAIAADGTIAIAATAPLKGDKDAVRPAIRVIPAGSIEVGPVVPVSDERLSGYVSVSGGANLVVGFGALPPSDRDAPDEARVVRRLPDGTFAPALTTPGAQADFNSRENVVAAVAQLPTGDLFSITSHFSTDTEDSDCFNPVLGDITAGPLATPGQPEVEAATTQLSARGQIALAPQAGTLADGSVIAAWQDAAGYSGDRRLEVAVRAPGAPTFAAAQVLPKLVQEDAYALATNGDHAALAWLSYRGRRSQVVVSALRTTAPYATRAARPRHPAAPCDE